MNGSAVQLDESGTRASISDGVPAVAVGAIRGRRMPPGVSDTKAPVASKCPTKPRVSPPAFAVHDTYGVLPKNVMSGWLGVLVGRETGLPPLNSSKWSPPTSRDTKIAWRPPPTSSANTIHGTVGPPWVSVPAATRGSSASCVGALLSEQASSAAVETAQGRSRSRPTCRGG